MFAYLLYIFAYDQAGWREWLLFSELRADSVSRFRLCEKRGLAKLSHPESRLIDHASHLICVRFRW